MFKKIFNQALKFYFWEVIDSNEPPSRWKPTKHKDGIITMWKTEFGKSGLTSHQAYDPTNERFLTTSEYWRRSDEIQREKYGEPMIVPIMSKEWDEFQEWKKIKEQALRVFGHTMDIDRIIGRKNGKR